MSAPDRKQFQLVLTTCPDSAVAERIARELIETRAAACVNIVPISKSVYLWRGKVESTAEQLLVIKSMTGAYKSIESVILKRHPYETPEVVAVPIVEGSTDYLSWIADPDRAS
jgi:periplasmic divalent cation tolerance protein